MDHEQALERALAERDALDLRRQTRAYPGAGARLHLDGREVLNFAGNDYLDLAGDPRVCARSIEYIERYGAGAGASRLVCGTLPCHEELESRIAAHKGYDAALLFGSGFLTNCGVIPALAGRGDTVFADRLAHASIIDAVRMSGARLKRFRHNDTEHLRECLAAESGGIKLVVTESVFSMDGDLAPLVEIADAADEFGALIMVDEAHATGIFGAGGAGRVAEAGLQDRVALCMGTLSKALGGYGGYAACSAVMREHLVNHARSFIYTTGLPPAACGAALGALDALAADPARGLRLLERAAEFRAALQAGGLDTLASESQVVPVMAGGNRAALSLAERLWEQSLLVVAMRPPTVPEGTARLRISLSSAHGEQDLHRVAAVIIDQARALGVAA